MANEAVLKDRMMDPVNFACGDGPAMEKGTIVVLSGPRGVKPSAADGDVCIGVLHREKIVGDGRTQVPVHLYGIFDCVFDTAVTAGVEVGISGPNILKVFTAGDDEDGTVLGRVLETVPDGGGTYQVILGGK